MAKNITNINIDILKREVHFLSAQNINKSAKKGGPLFGPLFLSIFEHSKYRYFNSWYFYVYFYGNFYNESQYLHLF